MLWAQLFILINQALGALCLGTRQIVNNWMKGHGGSVLCYVHVRPVFAAGTDRAFNSIQGEARMKLVMVFTACSMAFSVMAADSGVQSAEGFSEVADGPSMPFPAGGEGTVADLGGIAQPAMPDLRIGEYGDADGPGDMMIYDFERDELTRIKGPKSTRSTPFPVKRGGNFDGILPIHDGAWEESAIGRGFNDMTAVTDEVDAPWRRNVEIRMLFTDNGGTQRAFVGSATMVDAQTLITAGHCVYMRTDGNGNVYNTWADQITVRPAWDGDDDNWGSSICLPTATSMMWWTGWSDDGDFDSDVGLINVDRPVGMLTGWHGVAAGGTCSSVIDDYAFHNASYPSENCPSAGLHTGNQMYYWFGTFDDCASGNQFELDTGGGNCFDTVWGGMSGSSAYFIEDDSRYVLGICSNSDRLWSGRYTHVWGNVQDNLYDTVIPNGRGADFDPHAMYARASSSSLDAGNSIPDFKFTISNPTEASSTDDYSFTVYLSDDDNITAADTVISNQSGSNWTVNDMSNFVVNMVDPTIPLSTTSGTYYVGVAMSCGSDTDSSNDVTQTWDALELDIDAVTSLEFDSFEVTPGEVIDGGDIDVDFSLTNEGGLYSGVLTINYYASTNSIISVSDTLIHTQNSGGLSGGSTLNSGATITLPAGLAGSSYDDIWIGAIVTATGGDSVTGLDNSSIVVYVRPANDDCANASAIGNGDTSIDTTYATTDGDTHASCQFDGQTYNDIWYTYTATCTGNVTFTTCDQADYDTDLVLYAGSTCGDLTLVDCNDDATGCSGFSSSLTAYAVEGEEFYLRVGGYGSSDSGTGTITVSCDLVVPANDDCANAVGISSGDTFIDTQLATTDGFAHEECATAGDNGWTVNDIWFVWNADCNGTVEISTCGTVSFDSDLVLYEWTGDCGDTVDPYACNDDGPGCPGYSSLLTTTVVGGQDYLLRVGGWNGGQAGTGWISINCEPYPLDGDLNDDGEINIDDLLILLGAYGTSDAGDVDGDGDTDIEDLLAFLSLWGT